MRTKKPFQIAVYGTAGCRACENNIIDLHYQVNSFAGRAEFKFWPYLLGSSFDDLGDDLGKDLREDPGDNIGENERFDLAVFAGSVRNEADAEAARTLREKSDILLACGACAALGGLPGLAHLNPDLKGSSGEGSDLCSGDRDNAQENVQDNAEELDPALALPKKRTRVQALSQVVPVDYTVPGCPPTQNLLWAAISSILFRGEPTGRLSYVVSRLPEAVSCAILAGELPEKGITFAGDKAVCATCSRAKEEKRFSKGKRVYESSETGRCLLEQGLICQGITTREGCGGLCTGVGLPCRGCFGKADAVYDPGAKMVSAISSTFDTDNAATVKAIADSFIDMTGTFYRYGLPTQCALLDQNLTEKGQRNGRSGQNGPSGG